jgi:hypothetical protein
MYDGEAKLWWFGAGMGTLYLSDATLLSETLTDNLFTGVRLQIPGFNSWSVSSLTVSNCSVELAESGFQLTVANSLSIGTNGYLGVGAELGSTLVGLSCGDIALADGGSLSVYSGPTGAQDYGALVDVANDVVVGSGSWLYPYSHNMNGGSPLFQMQNLLISTGGGIDAIGKGFAHEQGPGKGISGSRASGGGYGGVGGVSQSLAAGGGIYGSTTAPIDPGSGGGIYYYAGGRGGGAVRIEAAGNVTHNGTITADADLSRLPGYGSGGGGSGGAIYIQCGIIAGSGTLSANGGVSINGLGGAGGGGRISIDVDTDDLTGETPGTYVEYTSSVNVSVDCGTGSTYEPVASNGSFYLAKAHGMLIIIR